jgi:hypothetical protein
MAAFSAPTQRFMNAMFSIHDGAAIRPSYAEVGARGRQAVRRNGISEQHVGKPGA